MKDNELELLKSCLPNFIDEANGILFYGGDTMDELVSSFAHRWGETKPESLRILEKLVETKDGELTMKGETK